MRVYVRVCACVCVCVCVHRSVSDSWVHEGCGEKLWHIYQPSYVRYTQRRGHQLKKPQRQRVSLRYVYVYYNFVCTWIYVCVHMYVYKLISIHVYIPWYLKCSCSFQTHHIYIYIVTCACTYQALESKLQDEDADLTDDESETCLGGAMQDQRGRELCTGKAVCLMCYDTLVLLLYINESGHTYECKKRSSCATQMNMSCHEYEWALSRFRSPATILFWRKNAAKKLETKAVLPRIGPWKNVS